MSGRYALLIATYQYEDDGLRSLESPTQDVEALARVLENSAIGGYQTTILLNRPSNEVRREIELFFANRKREDLLLLYFSGHGIKDDYGRLYFATSETMRSQLRSTAVSANFVNETMRDSLSRQQILLLDCCYSGAFAKGMVVKADTSIGTVDYFEGKGRFILTASDSMQYAFEGDNIKGEGGESIFTRAVVNGLETGQADRNQDGLITLDELYEYVLDRVTDETPKQVPEKYALGVQGEVVVATNPSPVVKPIELLRDAAPKIRKEATEVRRSIKDLILIIPKGIRFMVGLIGLFILMIWFSSMFKDYIIAFPVNEPPSTTSAQMISPSTSFEPELSNTEIPEPSPSLSTSSRAILPSPTTSVPTPRPTEIKLPAADILIAEFDTRHASQTLEVAHRLEADLEEQLRISGLQDVRVRVIPQTVRSEDEAQLLVNQTNSKVVVWGWYDDRAIRVNIFLSGADQPGKEVPGSSEIPLEPKDVPLTGLSFIVQDVLPENTTFLSLFVIGHLYYMGNNYLDGHTAYDAAMQSIPETVALENEALIHFFTARLLDLSESSDQASIVCEYAKAIELDPFFAEAYNNLGVAVTRFPELYSPYLSSASSLPQEVSSCLEPLGMNRIEDFFTKALELQPGWALAEFNKWATYWWTSIWYSGLSNDPPPASFEEIKAGIESVAERDKSIVMAPIVLANMAVLYGHYDEAIEWFIKALEQSPNMLQLHHNLGQVYLKIGQIDAAEEEFQTILDQHPDSPETLLALANLSYLRNDMKAVSDILEMIRTQAAEVAEQVDPEFFISREYTYGDGGYLGSYVPANMADILQSRLEFNSGEIEQAIRSLENVIERTNLAVLCEDSLSLIYYQLANLYTLNGNEEQANESWSQICPPQNMIYLEGHLVATNATTLLAWWSMIDACDYFTDPRIWGTEEDYRQCLPSDISPRIELGYEEFQKYLDDRMYYVAQRYINLSAECPYLFVFDPDIQAWKTDGTILYKIKGHENESTEVRPLTMFDGQILIREIEPELTFIDSLYVIISDLEGNLHRLETDQPELRQADGHYVVLKQGEELMIHFDGFEAIERPEKYWIVTKGYYIPAGNR